MQGNIGTSLFLAYGLKINNLFTYNAFATLKDTCEVVKYSAEPIEIVLWHHRLAHTSYSTLGTMKRLGTALGFSPNVHYGLISQCMNCPFGKQIQTLFQKTQELPNEIGDVITSDVCGPFKLSIGGYKYLITWIDAKSRYISIEFLKNKECATIMNSFYTENFFQADKLCANAVIAAARLEVGGSLSKLACKLVK